MKTIKSALMVSLIFLFSVNLNAQSLNGRSLSELSKIVTNNLQSNSEGVAESSIFVSIQFKNRYPNADNKIILNALNELATNSNSAKISYKAQLAKIYYENSELFKEIKINSIFDDQRVFEQISEKLNSVVLVSDLNLNN